jgi:hypothetical protein
MLKLPWDKVRNSLTEQNNRPLRQPIRRDIGGRYRVASPIEGHCRNDGKAAVDPDFRAR